MKMSPRIESDVIGRHGQIGVEVLSHDLPLEVGIPVETGFAEMVDEMDRRLAEALALERAMAAKAAKERRGQIAVADMVSVQTPEVAPAETEQYGLYL